MQKQKSRQFNDGFEVVTTTDTLDEIKEIISQGPEQDRVHSIVKTIIGDSETVEWYSSETHSGDDRTDEYKALNSYPDLMNTVYNSLHIAHGPSGYNIIDIGHDENYTYFTLSMNGSWLASALTDYYRVSEGNAS